MKIVFHAINGVGLGHLVRALALATEVRSIAPDARLLVATTARDTSLLDRAGIDYVQLPARLAEPHADPDRALDALPDALEEAALAAVLDTFAPDLVVFDTHAPMAIVRRLKEHGARSVLVLRELRPEALRAFAASGASLEFDRIVVPHEPGEVELSALDGAPVEIVGPVVLASAGSAGISKRRHAEEKSSPQKTPRVLAIAGGGGQPVDARRYLRAIADAHCLVRARIPNLETILVTGPYGQPPSNVDRFAGLTVRSGVADLGPLMAKATLVVSQAGYNAVAEIRARRVAAVLVPGFRKSEDQRGRAQRLARVKACVIAKPEARSIADQIEALLTKPGAIEAMRRAHDLIPLVPQNRRAAEAILRPVFRAKGPVRRVALVAHDFAPRLGGMETVARALAFGLLESGVDVRVYTADRLGATLASGLPKGVVRPLFSPLPGARRIDLWGDLCRAIDAALEDAPDVIHLCHAGLGAWIPALRSALPCIVTTHVHGNDLLAPWVHHGASTEAFAKAHRDGLAEADAVVAVSEFSASLARQAGLENKVIHVVTNGVDADRFSKGPRDPDLAHRLGIDPAHEVVLCVSRLAARKGHRSLLSAIAMLREKRPRLHFYFTGVNETLSRELLDMADTIGIRSRVHPLGFVEESDLPGLYRLADVFALTPDPMNGDDVEGFGVALLEASATALPTVGARTGGVPEAIEDGVTGLLVEPNDPSELAKAIDYLFENPSVARAFGDRGRERAAHRFSESRAASEVLRIWNEIAIHRDRRVPSAETATGLRGSLREVLEAPVEMGLVQDEMTLQQKLVCTKSGVELVRLASRLSDKKRQARARRKAELEAMVARGRVVRIRATSDGAVRLPAALADCAELGIRPRVEVKLRRFLEPDFAAYALPLVDSVELVHGVPHADASNLLEKLRRIPDSVAKVRAVRLFLSHEARENPALAVAAVPEAHALRKLFKGAGAIVVPPPELMRYLSETPAGGPETAMIEPTNLCNLACPTCPTGTGKIKPLPAMSLDRFDEAIAGLGPQVRNLALWNYGEPLLNRELPKMIAHAKTAGVRVVKVSSNVHFLDGERGRALLGSGLDVLILSVDGASQATYATFRKDGDFDRVAKSVAWLTSEKKRLDLSKPRIELQFIAMRHNEHEIPEMRRLARDWGVDKLRIKTVGADDDDTRHLIPRDRLLSRYDAAAREPNMRHPFCTMAWDHSVINVDGSVTPCCYLRPDMGEEFIMGNAFETPFSAIWRGSKYRAFRAQMLDGRRSMPVCNKCRGGTHDLLAAVEEVERT